MFRPDGMEKLEWMFVRLGALFFCFSFVWLYAYENALRAHRRAGGMGQTFANLFGAIRFVRWTWGPAAVLAGLDLWLRSPLLAWVFWAAAGLSIVSMTVYVLTLAKVGHASVRRAERMAASADLVDVYARPMPNPLTFYRRGPRPAHGCLRLSPAIARCPACAAPLWLQDNNPHDCGSCGRACQPKAGAVFLKRMPRS